MRQVNMHEAKTHLSELVNDALAGEEIVLARRGKPAVRLVPVEAGPSRQRRPIGLHARRLNAKTIRESIAPIDSDVFGFE